jgi:hypothetical protein
MELARQLRDDLLFLPPSQHQGRLRSTAALIRSEMGDDAVESFMLIFSIGQGRSTYVEVLVDQSKKYTAGGDVNVNDKSQSAGGNMTGVVGGSHNVADIHDVTSFAQALDQQPQIPTGLRESLRQARIAIEDAKLDEAEKKLLLDNFSNLFTEVSKPSPSKNVLGMLWGGMKSMVGQIPALIQLGIDLAKTYGSFSS